MTLTLNAFAAMTPNQQAHVIKHEQTHERNGHTSVLLADLRLIALIRKHAAQGVADPRFAKDQCALILEAVANINTNGLGYDKEPSA